MVGLGKGGVGEWIIFMGRMGLIASSEFWVRALGSGLRSISRVRDFHGLDVVCKCLSEPLWHYFDI